MTWQVNSPDDVQTVLDYFNGFHDGFIHKLILRSYDRFDRQGPEITDIAHHVTGCFDMRLDLAHYNYGQGTQPHDRIVRGFFKNIQDFHLDLRGRKSYEWPIKNVEITRETRETELGGPEPCFRLTFVWGQLVDQTWTTRSVQLCTFSHAEFEERTLSS